MYFTYKDDVGIFVNNDVIVDLQEHFRRNTFLFVAFRVI